MPWNPTKAAIIRDGEAARVRAATLQRRAKDKQSRKGNDATEEHMWVALYTIEHKRLCMSLVKEWEDPIDKEILKIIEF